MSKNHFAAFTALILGGFTMTAIASDPARVKGQLKNGDQTYALKHVQTWQEPGQNEELWVYLTDVELPLSEAKRRFRAHELAGEGKLHGIYIVLDPRSPDLTRLTGNLLVPVAKRGASMPSMSVSGTAKLWDTLKLGDKRIVGKLNYSRKGDDSLGWLPIALQVEFDAPISGSDVKVRTLTGTEAQNSPQAAVYLVYEETLIKEGLSSALKKYATPERQALIQEQMRNPGAEEDFKQYLAEMKANLPKGQARRKQVKKVIINENEAKLQMETGEEEDLVRSGGKWLLN